MQERIRVGVNVTPTTRGMSRGKVCYAQFGTTSISTIKKCPERVPIDIECEHRNPYLSLFLYPYGLFSDKNKSMTLLVKTFTHDDCPPIPVTASFSMSWRVCTDAGILAHSKEPIQVLFEKAMVYVHKFLPHSVLKENCCKMLKISIHLSTSYSVRDIDSYSNDETTDKDSQMAQKCSGIIMSWPCSDLLLWLPAPSTYKCMFMHLYVEGPGKQTIYYTLRLSLC